MFNNGLSIKKSTLMGVKQMKAICENFLSIYRRVFELYIIIVV